MDIEFIKDTALEAGKAIMEIYASEDFGTEMKKNSSPLTKADTKANKIIVSRLRKKYPEIGILTEEEADDKTRLDKELVWIIDPMDGTKEFINRNGEFTVNIGLAKNGKPIMGVILVPAKNEMFWADENGAFNNISRKIEKITVSSNKEIPDMVLAKSRSHSGEKEKALIENNKFKAVISSGSSLKGCLIARGVADAYFRFGPTNEWDICAMHAILNAAGGKMTDLEGNEIVYNKKKVKINGFLASNNQIHDILIEKGK